MTGDVSSGSEELRTLLEQNREMRRLLEEHQWSGVAPVRSAGLCPECRGSRRNGHRRGCAIARLLRAPAPS
jgi:hypothetical protein